LPEKEEPKFKKIVDAADGLSLGISMVVAVLIGVSNNVYIAYRKQKASLDELARDPRYRHQREIDADDEDDDERY